MNDLRANFGTQNSGTPVREFLHLVFAKKGLTRTYKTLSATTLPALAVLRSAFIVGIYFRRPIGRIQNSSVVLNGSLVPQ